MKRILLLLFTVGELLAQAPDRLSRKQMLYTVESGTGPFATGGIGVRVFSGSGEFYTSMGLNINPTIKGTYVYTRASGTSAQIAWNDAGGLRYVTVLTFFSPEIGSYVSTSGADRQTGYFNLTAAPAEPLLNISARAILGSGQVLNPGFVVGGTIARRILVRAIGPTLAGFGVTGVLTTPKLTIFSGQTQIATNSGWGGTAELAAAFTSVGAFALPAGSADAALLLTLNPGSYTAMVNGGVGDVLVEVYSVD
jgi:hypothetical protein